MAIAMGEGTTSWKSELVEVNWLVRPMELKCCWSSLRCRHLRGVRQEAQLSDHMKADT